MTDYRMYDVQATLLTPLHIGSGVELLNEFDFAIYQGRTWRLNENALLAAQAVEDPAVAERLARTPPAQLLERADFRPDSEFFRYVVRGVPRSNAAGAQVKEQLKDAYDHPYLPGTSLKGALRTALAWVLWAKKGLKPEAHKLKRSAKFAGQNYEHELFGRDPNHDLLRALQVSDSAPVSAAQLMLANAQVIHRNGHLAAPVELEAVKPDTVFPLTLKVDRALFSQWAGRDRLQGLSALEQLATLVQTHTAARLKEEVAWFKGVDSARPVLGFLSQLQQMKLPPHMCILQLGWGTGWLDKTLGSHLQVASRFFDGVMRDYRLARGKRQSGDPFPKSRRVLVQVRRSRDGRTMARPVSSIGWLLLELKERAT
ncbi:MAG: type III-A CRISPR-associated RAMP protein Csm5 [Chloroflexi bacterium]|nr:MAG: type III-A CRISPR-associated RAMP protein Csm5 [Chloroflexota bacterium]